VFHAIVATVAGRRPVTAALGEAGDEVAIETTARAFAAAGASLVKVGFDGISNIRVVDGLARAAVRGARGGHAAAGVMLVAYADAPADAVSPAALLEVASSAGAAGVLLDTANKGGPRLTELVGLAWMTEWIRLAHRRSLAVALAGRLRAEDLPVVALSGADVAGVRGAACDGGRSGRIAAPRVRELTRAF
jgi:(5-formylfuran-3-yl)methyl phosphate synthase